MREAWVGLVWWRAVSRYGGLVYGACRSVSSLWGAWESVLRVVLRVTLLGALRGGAERGRWHGLHICVGVLGLVRAALSESESVCGCAAGPFAVDSS